MTPDLILSLDAGTTSTRAIAFGLDGGIVASCGRPITQHYPQPGWVEHDAAEIWAATRAAPTLSATSSRQSRLARQISAESCSTQPGCG